MSASRGKPTVYERLRDRILHFELYPGTRLTEQDLASQLGVSRTPVREAIQRLAAQGYVTVRPNYGCFVREFDIDEMSCHYQIRIALEQLSIDNAVACMGDQGIDELAELWSPQRVDEGLALDSMAMEARDESFHLALAAGGGNTALAAHLQSVNNHIRIIRRLDFTDSGRIRATFQEHSAILAHVRRRNAEAAKELMSTHIRHSEEVVKGMTLQELQHRRQQLSRQLDAPKT